MQSLSLSTSTKIGHEDHFCKALAKPASPIRPWKRTLFEPATAILHATASFLKMKIQRLNNSFKSFSYWKGLNKTSNELNVLKISKIKSVIQKFRRWKKGRFFYLHMVHFLLVFFSVIFSWNHWMTRDYDKWNFLLEEKVYFEASWLKFRGQFFVKCLNSLNQSWWPRRTQMFLSWFIVFCE